MFSVRIRLGGREYLGVRDTPATISIVGQKILPCGVLKNIMPTAAIRMGDGHVVHSCGDHEVNVPMGSRSIAHKFYVMDAEAFHFFWVPTSSLNTHRFCPSRCKRPRTIATGRNVYHWSSLN